MKEVVNELETWLGRQSWRRDGEGPCIRIGQTGAFDDTHVFCPAVIFDDGRYRMYYCGSRGAPADDSDRVYSVQTVLPLADGRWRIWYASRCSDFQAHKYFAIATAVCDGPKD